MKIGNGSERMSVTEADALLYLGGHSRAQLERALRISALPAGWRSSYEALLQQELNEGQAVGKGNPGLSVVSGSYCPETPESDVHNGLAELLRKYDVNDYAASVQVYAVKP